MNKLEISSNLGKNISKKVSLRNKSKDLQFAVFLEMRMSEILHLKNHLVFMQARNQKFFKAGEVSRNWDTSIQILLKTRYSQILLKLHFEWKI